MFVNLKFSTAYLLCLQLAINFANPILPEISSNRGELKRHGDLRRSSSPPLGPNIVLIHNFLGGNETQLSQDYQASSGNWTNETVMTTSKEMPFLLQGGIFDDTNNFVNSQPQLPTEAPASQQQQSSSSDSPRDRPLVYPSLLHQRQHQLNSTHEKLETADDSNNLVKNLQVQTEVPVSQSLSVDLPLFYPLQPAEPPKYRPDTHYGSPRETYNPQPRRRYNSKDSTLFRPFASASFKPNMLGFPPISNTRENVGLQVNWGAKIGRAHRSFYDFLMV